MKSVELIDFVVIKKSLVILKSMSFSFCFFIFMKNTRAKCYECLKNDRKILVCASASDHFDSN